MSLDVALAFLFSFTAACYLLLGMQLALVRRETGSMPLGSLFLLISIWVFGGAVELMATSFEMFSVGRTGHFIGAALLPVVVYVCFREYLGYGTPTRTIVLLTIIPVVSISLAATNQYHEFVWFAPFVNAGGEFLTRPAKWGPWFLFVHVPHSYLLLVAALLKLALRRTAVAPAQRRGLFLLVAASVGPLCAAMAYDLGFGPNTISFVPLAFSAMLPVYAWLILGERIVEFTPLAYETVFQNMRDPVVVLDDRDRVIGLNRGAEDLLEVSEQDALRVTLDGLFKDGATDVFEALATGQPQKMMTSTGRFLHVQVSPIQSGRRSTRGGRVLMFRDVSDVEKAQLEVRKSEKLLRTLIDHSVNGIVRMRWMQDEASGSRCLRIIFANAAVGRFLGVDPEDLVDRRGEDVIRLATSGMGAAAVQAIVTQFTDAVAQGVSVDAEVQHGAGDESRWIRLICEPVGDDIAATFIDITDRKAKERQMESIAWSDPLTGVLNRRGFERDAAQRLTDSADDASGALLFIDLNAFKQINDRYGHEVGDRLLTIAAKRLRTGLRPGDIIGRPGGDEFVALVPDVAADVADKLARRLAESLEKPYLIGSRSLHCAAAVGLALYPEHANTLTGLLREADQAMYRAKARTRGSADAGTRDLLERAG